MSVGLFVKNLLLEELSTYKKSRYSSPINPTENTPQHLLDSMSNMRELFLQSFGFLFESADAKDEFEKRIIQTNEHWEKLQNLNKQTTNEEFPEFSNLLDEISENEKSFSSPSSSLTKDSSRADEVESKTKFQSKSKDGFDGTQNYEQIS